MADLKQIKVGSTTYNIEPYSSYYRSGCPCFEMNNGGSLLGYGGFIDFHFFNSSGKPLDSGGTVVSTTPDYTSRIIEDSAGRIAINGTYITWSGLTSSSITSNGSVDANSARISNGLYVGSSITHHEQADLAIGNADNGAYVYFVEDIAGGGTPNEGGENNWTIGIDGTFSGTDFSGTSFSGDGSGLTNLNASNLSSGTVAYARLPVGTGSSQVAQGSHTHLYAGSSSAGGAATSANKVNHSITFNNSGAGVDSGTTFNGTYARTVSYNTIGALSYTASSTASKTYFIGKQTVGSTCSNYYNPDLYFTGASVYAGSFYARSDKRLKENIKDADTDYYDFISNIRLVKYNWKDDEDKIVQHGVIAQELKETAPEDLKDHLVSGVETDTDYLAVNDGKMVYIALGALQQQLKINQQLESRIVRLEQLLGV